MGVFTLILGIVRVGFLDSLISRPILHGFVSASAAIILVGQLDTLLGFHVQEQEWEKIIGVVEHIEETNYYALGIGVTCIAIIVSVDFIKQRAGQTFTAIRYVPTPLLIVAGSTLTVWLAGWEAKGVTILVCWTSRK